jgi:hypothetical protein
MTVSTQYVAEWAEQVCADVGRLSPAGKDFGRRPRGASAQLRRHAQFLIGNIEAFEARDGWLQ